MSTEPQECRFINECGWKRDRKVIPHAVSAKADGLDNSGLLMEAQKPGNAGGAKGDRKANPGNNRPGETPSTVPIADKQEGEDAWQRHRAERGVWSQGMLEVLERGVKGGKWFSLIDKIYAEPTLARSWEKVRSNAGSCGVDGITIARFEKQAERRLLAVNEQLKQGRYQPRPIRRTWIPKPGSNEKRPLGIPAVVDRVVQTATRMVVEPIYEHVFAPQSYGFRPGRSCKDALRRVDELLKSGHGHVVDIDIKGFFDSIPHDRLMRLVKEHIADGRVLGLIEPEFNMPEVVFCKSLILSASNLGNC